MTTNPQRRVAIVTGAAGGIGSAIARGLARDGFIVAVTDISVRAAEACADDLTRSYGIESLSYQLDVREFDDFSRVVEEVASAGPIHAMINCAGVPHVRPLLEITADEWDLVFRVNARGTLFGIQAAARRMVQSGVAGAIVNVASVAGQQGRPSLAAYAASKAAVLSLTQSSALALAPYGIRVNAVCPGVVATELGRAALEALALLSVQSESGQDITSVPSAPLSVEIEPEDVAAMVRFLCGEGARAVTGQALNVDGGRVMR